MGDTAALDMMLGALTCPFGTGHMGVTAENVAAEHQITREAQDAFALESQTRAAAAIGEGRFASQIVPIEVTVKRETVAFATDEHPKATTAEALAKLRPAFKKDGTVTAGNASGINDGAAAIVLATADAAEKAGLKPRARVLGYAVAGVRPEVMGIGPIPAVRKLLEKPGSRSTTSTSSSSNEAFAAQALAVSKGLGLDPAQGQPERRRDRARPPGRRDRRDPDGQGALRARADRRPARPRHHVHRRRPGHRAGDRAARRLVWRAAASSARAVLAAFPRLAAVRRGEAHDGAPGARELFRLRRSPAHPHKVAMLAARGVVAKSALLLGLAGDARSARSYKGRAVAAAASQPGRNMSPGGSWASPFSRMVALTSRWSP